MRKACALFLAGYLFLNSAAFGAAKGEVKETKEETIGIRVFDGTEVYFESCGRLDAAVQRGDAFFITDGCYEFTSLHWATFRHPHLVPQLLAAGAKLEARSVGGLTPLHMALRSGSYDVAKLLLHAGANPIAKTNNGLTPLHMLYFPGCTSCSDDTLDPEVSREEIATLIVNSGGDVDAQDDTGALPLHYALLGTKANEDLDKLIALGAKASGLDKEGIPAEFYAALAGNTAASERSRVLAGRPVKMLVNGQTKEGWVAEKRAENDTMQSTYRLERITRSRITPQGRDVYGASWYDYVCNGVVYGLGYAGCATFTGPAAFGCGAAWTMWMVYIDPCS